MTTWSFGGTALSTYGKVTMIDDDLDIPDKRGDNILIPFRHGKSFVEKFYDERTITFGIAIKRATAALLEADIDALKLKISPRALQVLSQTREDGSIRTAYAAVEKKLQVDRQTATFAKIILEFTLPFPFFRLSTVIADNTTTINANPKAMTVTNPGTVEETDPIITLTGPLSNTVITNSTNGSVFRYTGTIASPRVVTIQTVNGEFVATDDLAANKIANIGHSGFASLLVLNPGANSLSIADGTHTTGSVKISFYAPYL